MFYFALCFFLFLLVCQICNVVVFSQFGIPSWIVEMRHNATHRTMPSLSELTAGADWILEWLRVRRKGEGGFHIYTASNYTLHERHVKRAFPWNFKYEIHLLHIKIYTWFSTIFYGPNMKLNFSMFNSSKC